VPERFWRAKEIRLETCLRNEKKLTPGFERRCIFESKRLNDGKRPNLTRREAFLPARRDAV